jgi:hypothetical protein
MTAVELTTNENFTYYRVMLEEGILSKRTVADPTIALPDLPVTPAEMGSSQVQLLLMLVIIDIACKLAVFWQRCGVCLPSGGDTPPNSNPTEFFPCHPTLGCRLHENTDQWCDLVFAVGWWHAFGHNMVRPDPKQRCIGAGCAFFRRQQVSSVTDSFFSH